MLPDTVDRHSCRQRMIRCRQPLGELPSSTFVLWNGGTTADVNATQKSSGNDRSVLVLFAPNLQRPVARFFLINGRKGLLGRGSRWQLLLQVPKFIALLRQSLFRLR